VSGNGRAADSPSVGQFSGQSCQSLTKHGAQPVHNVPAFYEVIDSRELACRWAVPESWIREQTRSRTANPVPCVRLGRYVRYEWLSPELDKWWAKHRANTMKARII
jgi:hypothetical protein